MIEVQSTKPLVFKKSYPWTVGIDEPQATQDFKEFVLSQILENLEIDSIKNPKDLTTDFYARINIPNIERR